MWHAHANPGGSMGTRAYDTVIVGGGSAGAVLAARLTENPDRTVLLLEAGPAYPPDAYPDSVLSSSVVGSATGHDWGYFTEPVGAGHRVQAHRGKVLGGSSAVNGAVIVRALPVDFQRWAIPGWSWDELRPVFDRTLVPIRELERDELTPMERMFIDSALAVGIPPCDDFNGPKPEGAGSWPLNVLDGQRINTGVAYLTAEVRARPNLDIQGDALVDQVLLDEVRATGVLLSDGSEIAAGEVILSAGAYGSPAILLRSGIGPAADLTALDIPVITDLPVGCALQDHPFFLNSYAVSPDRIGALEPVLGGLAWLASSEAEPGELDLQISATHLFDPGWSPSNSGFLLAVGLMRPHSIGTLTLASRDPLAAPRIQPNYLATESDRRRLLEGAKLARRIATTDPLAGLIESELMPGSSVVDDAGLLTAMLSTVDTYHHPTSTAPIGAVVDPLGAVHGIEGLRVVDASIFPDVPQVPTNLTTIAAAEHVAARL
ncbi:dehydrogenase [Pseudonocardiaceae bacterium YIM PH 21723]|nr:dehydrogenase [Pseudonocardiaceae bacterium YIM PH 21723]